MQHASHFHFFLLLFSNIISSLPIAELLQAKKSQNLKMKGSGQDFTGEKPHRTKLEKESILDFRRTSTHFIFLFFPLITSLVISLTSLTSIISFIPIPGLVWGEIKVSIYYFSTCTYQFVTLFLYVCHVASAMQHLQCRIVHLHQYRNCSLQRFLVT